MAKKANLKVVIPSEPIKLDLGCGKNKKEGFLGVDRRKFPGVDVVTDLMGKWPWKNDTVAEIHMSHVMEHFKGTERVHIVNEMYRVMQKGAKALVIVPSWSSNRAYGDFTHQWPPVSDMWFYYLSKEWRAGNAPDNDIEWNSAGYNCDFECTWGYSLHPEWISKNQERQTFAIQFYKDAVLDIIATLTKK
jgi:hypothetical protein